MFDPLQTRDLFTLVRLISVIIVVSDLELLSDLFGLLQPSLRGQFASEPQDTLLDFDGDPDVEFFQPSHLYELLLNVCSY